MHQEKNRVVKHNIKCNYGGEKTVIKETLIIRIPEDNPRCPSIGLYLPKGRSRVRKLKTRSHTYVNTIRDGMASLFDYKV